MRSRVDSDMVRDEKPTKSDVTLPSPSTTLPILCRRIYYLLMKTYDISRVAAPVHSLVRHLISYVSASQRALSSSAHKRADLSDGEENIPDRKLLEDTTIQAEHLPKKLDPQ